MYKITVASEVSDLLVTYAEKFALDNGTECALNLVNSFDEIVSSLAQLPQRGVKKLTYIPKRYHVIRFWKHLWLVYEINESDKNVYIDMLIDDRSDYGKLL